MNVEISSADAHHECLNHDTINALEAHNENCLGTFFSSPNEILYLCV
jgi:hypothetical protein